MNDLIPRRQFILKTVALAAGISFMDLNFLLTSDASKLPRNLQTKLKILKVKLSGFNINVFQSEFGRITPMKPASRMGIAGLTQGMGCPVHSVGGLSGASAASSCPQFSGCGINAGTGSCFNFENCVTNVCSGQDTGGDDGGVCGMNDCNDQSCPALGYCDDNECSSQDCPSLSTCGKNKVDITGLIGNLRNDPYIQGLMEHFHTTNTNQLSSQIQRMIKQKRHITPQQVMPGALKTPAIRPKTY